MPSKSAVVFMYLIAAGAIVTWHFMSWVDQAGVKKFSKLQESCDSRGKNLKVLQALDGSFVCVEFR